MGRDSSVGIATRYGMGDPWIESWWRQDFPHPSTPSYTVLLLPFTSQAKLSLARHEGIAPLIHKLGTRWGERSDSNPGRSNPTARDAGAF